ncbi:hypothetical protein QJQ45_015784 [Haematococcus lacustris]|nr:hypothetical protein QJQ45_015784 [Haematococcus lacustris]
MAAPSSGCHIPDLDDTTWRDWSMRVEGFLIENSLWDLVETGVTALPPAPGSSASADARAAYVAAQSTHRAELASDAKAKALIKRYTSRPYLQLVHDAASAKEAWASLESEFTQVSVARQTQLQQRLSLLRMQPDETVANFFSRIYQLKSDLEACNCSISESNIVLTVIANLTSDYKPSAQQLRYEQTGPTGLTLSRVKRVMQFREADLLLEQQQEHASSPSSLFAFSSSSSRGPGSSGGGGGRGRGRSLGPRQTSPTRSSEHGSSSRRQNQHADALCYYCNKTGHIMAECFTFDKYIRQRLAGQRVSSVRSPSPGKGSSPARGASPARGGSPRRTSVPPRGRAQTPGRPAAVDPSDTYDLFTANAEDDYLVPLQTYNTDLYEPFYIDSGASQHMITDREHFSSYTAFRPDEHKAVRLAADGHVIYAVGQGTVWLNTQRGPWQLSKALHVPASRHSFISVSAATDDGASFTFTDDQCIIRDTRLRVKARKFKSSYILAAVPLPADPYGMQQPHLHSYSAAAPCSSYSTAATQTDAPVLRRPQHGVALATTMGGKRPSKTRRQSLQELNASPKAGFKCTPNGLKSQRNKAQVEAMKLRAQVEQLHQQLGDAVADYQLLQADMEQLQAAHQEVQGENESLEQLAEERTHAIQLLEQDKRRLSLALRNVRRCRPSGPRLTRHQRQLMNILMRHRVSPEVLQRHKSAAASCYSHGIHNTLLKGLVVLPGTRAAITDLSSLLAQHWVALKLDRWGAKPETPCDTRWASYITAASSLLAIWRHAGDAVAEVVECQQRRAPAWARELCKHLQDSDLLLKITVVAVVGQTYLMPELLWASKDDGLHAFQLYRHIQQVCKGLQQPWANNAQLLSQLHSKLQQLVPADQREHQKQQLATYLQQHCAAMEEYYTQHCKRQLDMPHLMAALGGSDPQSCKEVAAKVVQCAALRMDDGQSDPGVWDPHCTWQQFEQDIHAMAEGSPCSTGLRLHLEVYFLACPTSNAPVESLLQLLKHGAGRFMELPALLEHMSLHTLWTTLNSVDVHDFTLQLPKLRTAVRLEEVAAASARAPARAARKATAAACCVGGVVVNVGDHASQQRVAAAAAAGCSRVVPAGVPPPQPPLPQQPPPQQPPQQQGRSSWGTALEGQMLAPPIASPQGPIASPDLRHMYQLALAAIATQGQAAPAQGSELGAAAPAPGFTLRKRTTPAGLGLPKTAAKRKRKT